MADEDIKIAGFPAKKPEPESDYAIHSRNGNIQKAKLLGAAIAERTVSAAALSWDEEHEDSFGLKLQRGILLAFAAVVSVESAVPSGTLCDVIKQAFYEELGRDDPQLYKETTESGAFSFYYLAYRRGIEIERRVGQTFAMLCSHDGDPVYQEIGETLYCWMCSKVKKELGAAAFVL